MGNKPSQICRAAQRLLGLLLSICSCITALCSPGPAGVLSGKLEAAVAVNHRIAVQHPPSWPGELYRAAGISQSKDVQHVPS